MKKTYLFVLVILFISATIGARPWRPGQIPNGTKFSCANCHVDPNGGGARNSFGQEVEKHVSVGGQEEFWNNALAILDSDLDGKNNGSELQDPTGAWRSGQANPGNFSLVTNPGNSSSVSVSFENPGTPKSFKLYGNYPNPFNPTTTITYSLSKNSRVTIYVYNVIGQQVALLAENEFKPAGNYKVVFNGEQLPSGIYLYRMETPEYMETQKMVLLK